jgi:hypothetical protein
MDSFFDSLLDVPPPPPPPTPQESDQVINHKMKAFLDPVPQRPAGDQTKHRPRQTKPVRIFPSYTYDPL